MEAWTLDITLQELAFDVAFMGTALLLGIWLRSRLAFLQKYLIPSAIIAGFLGLLAGPEVLGVVTYSMERMGAYVYHLLALTFVCVSLKARHGSLNRPAAHLGFFSVFALLIQAVVGILIVLVYSTFVDATVSPAAGILLALGFATGPGVAYSIGSSWAAFGFEEGASVGLTFAAIGFLVAYVVGIRVVYRSGYTESDIPLSLRTGLRPEDEWTEAGKLTMSPAAVEPLAFHVAAVAAVYGVVYLTTWGLAAGLEALGRPQEVPVVWSFHFILATGVALLIRRIAGRWSVVRYLDVGLLDRMAGVLTDFLVVASIMAISLSLAARYAVPILLLVGVGGLLTFVILDRLCRLVFERLRLERFLGVFGSLSGTLSSALALLRILDPEYRTSVAQELAVGSAYSLAMAFPLLAALSIPFTVYEGQPVGFLVLMGIMSSYLLVVGLGWLFFLRRTGRQ